jgi:predicted TIM-barrel fold metal-dependent hydrolase
MIIDIHQHVNWLGRDEQGLIDYLDRAGVDKCWLLTWESVDGGLEPTYKHLSFEEVGKTHKMFLKRIIPFCGIDPRRPNAEALLRELHQKGFRGYGELKFKLLADDPDMIKMLKVAGELGMPALFHLDPPIPATPQWYAGDIVHLERAAQLCPRTAIIGHGPGFWREISGNAQKVNAIYPKGRVTPGGRLWKALEKNRNIYADLSANSCLNALKRDTAYAKKLLVRFRKKIMYGTDSYNTDLKEFLNALGLPKGVLRDIMGGNAERLLRK